MIKNFNQFNEEFNPIDPYGEERWSKKTSLLNKNGIEQELTPDEETFYKILKGELSEEEEQEFLKKLNDDKYGAEDKHSPFLNPKGGFGSILGMEDFKEGDSIVYMNPESRRHKKTGKFVKIRDDGKFSIVFDDGEKFAASPQYVCYRD